jgi:single-stranded-DNA-specific exonuclease
MDSLRLLCTTDPDRASRLAQDLNRTNRARQDLTESLFKTASNLVDSADKHHPIVVARPDFHEGVIGLVAGKLAQKFWRPAVVISKSEIFSKASARSIPGFNIIDVLRQIDKLMESCGGHPQAAGFSIRTERITQFIDNFTKISRPLLTPDILSRNLNIDAEIKFSDISPQLLDVINLLHPTGIGNPAPTFSTDKLTIGDLKTVGQDAKHLRLFLNQGEIRFSAIGFGLGNLAVSLSPGQSVSAAYTPFISTFSGSPQIELKLKDIKS